MRIVHTVSSLQGGGMEHFVLRLAEAQQRRGHRVTIVSLQGGPLEEQARLMGLRAIVLGGRNKHVRLLKGALVMARLRPDITNAHNPTSLHYALLGKLLGGGKLVMTDHGAGRGVIRVPGGLERRKTDAVVCVSEDTARRAADHGILHNLLVIHNGVEMKAPQRSRAEVRAELGLPEDRVVGAIVATVDHVKAHDVLVAALALLKEGERGRAHGASGHGQRATDDATSSEFRVPSDRSAVDLHPSPVLDATPNAERPTPQRPNDPTTQITVLVVGDGPERPNTEEQAAALGLGEDHIRMLGFRSDVPEILGASDFFALTSRREGLPLAILEAMSHRLPIVATCVGGIPELVTDGEHGCLVPPDDCEALAGAIGRVAADPEFRKRAGEAGYRLVADRFTFE